MHTFLVCKLCENIQIYINIIPRIKNKLCWLPAAYAVVYHFIRLAVVHHSFWLYFEGYAKMGSRTFTMLIFTYIYFFFLVEFKFNTRNLMGIFSFLFPLLKMKIKTIKNIKFWFFLKQILMSDIIKGFSTWQNIEN